MDNITQLATFKALEQSRFNRNADTIDSLLPTSEAKERAGLVRVQFETAPDLRTELDQICSAFGISKREFLECALIDSLQKATRIFGDIARETGAAPGTPLYAFGNEKETV